MAIPIDHVNHSDLGYFVELLGGIFEHSPWVAQRAYLLQPFGSRSELHQVMVNTVRQAPEAEQLELLRQHPELAGKEAAADTLTAASKNEQAGAGLNACSNDELERIRHLNQSYYTRFRFPFIIAVGGLDRHQIIAAMERRLDNDPAEEFATALGEVEKIALLRLEQLIHE